MGRNAFAIAAIPWLMTVLSGGCATAPQPRGEMFGPSTVRIHPTFTQWKDWSGDGKPDGIEVSLEMLDQFGEPTRATGRVMFETYEYRPTSPDVHGKRSGGPWIIPLYTKADQESHWSRAVRAYNFRLDLSAQKKRYTVINVTFDAGGEPGQSKGRLFDQLILDKR